MRNFTTMVLLQASILAAGLLAVSSLYANEHSGSSAPKAEGGMMGRGGMMGDGGMMGRGGMMGDGGMMGRGGMMGDGGMMDMMGQMSRMMDQCASMMQGGNRPNEQWRKPTEPDKRN